MSGSPITLHEGDNRDHLKRLIGEGVRVHSVVCDPPYGLVSVTRRFGKDGAAPARFGTDGAFARASGGFMGQSWDASGIERDPEFWRLIWEILLPGGYCLAFSSPRTGHWQACAMETAGFVMHPFLGWVYGQGFPKAHNAAKAIDATLLLGRMHTEDMRRLAMGDDYEPSGRGRVNYDNGCASKMNGATTKQEAQTDEALRWNGWAYGGQALKPALEPIYVGQKPFSEKNGALNLLRHGVGALNIDATRVGPQCSSHQQGRHPANLLHDGSPEVVALFPQAPGQLAPVSSAAPSAKTKHCYGRMRREGEASAERRYADAGSTNFAATPGMRREPESSAARFFNSFPLPIEEVDPIRYQAKAGKADRAGSKHPTVKPIALMRWLVRLVTPPGGIVLDPFAGTGTTAAAARDEGFACILMEADHGYAADIRARFGLTAADEFSALFAAPMPAADEFAELLSC